MKLKHVCVVALLFTKLSAQTPEYGPEKGTLVIQGGGSAQGTGIDETFVNLAGSPMLKLSSSPPPQAIENPTERPLFTMSKRSSPHGRNLG
jgi:hypothetical protein